VSRAAELIAADHPDCPFCAMWAWPDKRPSTWWTYPSGHVARLTPLNPVVYGHVLFIPLGHVADAGVLPDRAAGVMRCAASYVQGLDAANIITSKGAAATQTVPHFHLHVVPRRDGDGLALPWTGQVKP
jgi:histidine triad (HIT) family protein